MNLMWFKRDLRVTDHQALAASLAAGPTVGLFIFEPDWSHSEEFGLGQLKFVLESLEELKRDLLKKGIPLVVRKGSALSVLMNLHRERKITRIFSHQETGLDWSFRRDLQIKAWTKEQGIPWQEFKQFGVVRKLQNRDTWNKKRIQIIERPLVQVSGQSLLQSPWSSEALPFEKLEHLPNGLTLQKGGRTSAENYLSSFLAERGKNYIRNISSPVRAFEGCSRLSPYFTWGNLTMSEVHQALLQKRNQLKNKSEYFGWKLSLQQFESRLWWHCHFIQKLESEPEIEFQNFNRNFDGLRESEFDEAKFQAWCRGETGFPMIDACMRALHRHGWINFRMRALLMSFASYQLWLHWKRPAEFLASHFVDFEPGIHYSQAQMQSGVTGINSIRIYSPKKQALEQDPTGEFIKKYIPELSLVPASDIAEPHLMPPLLQIETGYRPGVNYPDPIVDPEGSYQAAKDRIFAWKKRPEVRKASQTVLKRHASRKNTHFPTQKRDTDQA